MVLCSIQAIRKIMPTIKMSFLCRISNAPACWALSLPLLVAFLVFWAVPIVLLADWPAHLAAAYSFFDGLLLLPTGDRIAGKLGISDAEPRLH